jgi:ubiquinone biosynthesis accessory factor UbiJ
MSAASKLESMVISALEQGFARLLALDPAMVSRLAELQSRSVHLTLAGLNMRLQARVHDSKIRLNFADDNEVADLSVRTELGNLVQLGVARISGAKPSIGIGKIHISGDAELARQLQEMTAQFDPDWDAPFSSLFGDVLGFQLARGAKQVAQFARRGLSGFAQSASEYVREESKDVVPRAELEQFYDEVDALRDRVARAERSLQKMGVAAASRSAN